MKSEATEYVIQRFIEHELIAEGLVFREDGELYWENGEYAVDIRVRAATVRLSEN